MNVLDSLLYYFRFHGFECKKGGLFCSLSRKLIKERPGICVICEQREKERRERLCATTSSDINTQP